MLDLIRANWHQIWPEQWKTIAIALIAFGILVTLWVACRVMEAVEEFHRTERAIEGLRKQMRRSEPA